MHFQGERVDSFYDLRGYLPDAHFAKRGSPSDSSDNFTLCPKIFKLCTRSVVELRHMNGEVLCFTCPVV